MIHKTDVAIEAARMAGPLACKTANAMGMPAEIAELNAKALNSV
jgi:hypothetical protein